ncbi:MAG: hypothetical protein K2P64_03300 [Lachnospiraceae bacterium]|nr:hypothetical protein [Lachnospiraceae bacterium]
MNISNTFPWSDNWWFEDHKAWFIIGSRNILCCFNLSNYECEVMVNVPDVLSRKFRAVSKCMKYQNEVYCFPVFGNNIWVYSIEDGSFSSIPMEMPPDVCPEIYDFWEYNGEIFAVSMQLKTIFVINPREKRIENAYVLCEEGYIAKSVKVGTAIYSLSGMSEKIYKFDFVTRRIVTFQLPHMGRKFSTICFDGENFWLGGYREEVYLWYEEKNRIAIYPCSDEGLRLGGMEKHMDNGGDCIAQECEIPVFLYSAAVGKYSWFIPYQTNRIIYADKESHRLCAIEVSEEMEDEESSWQEGDLKVKFVLVYVRENRYLGIFSISQNQMLEIDAEQLTYKWCDYHMGDKSIKKYAELVDREFYESIVWEREVYKEVLRRSSQNVCDGEREKMGVNIYTETIR